MRRARLLRPQLRHGRVDVGARQSPAFSPRASAPTCCRPAPSDGRRVVVRRSPKRYKSAQIRLWFGRATSRATIGCLLGLFLKSGENREKPMNHPILWLCVLFGAVAARGATLGRDPCPAETAGDGSKHGRRRLPNSGRHSGGHAAGGTSGAPVATSPP